jgi:hypothetical protein
MSWRARSVVALCLVCLVYDGRSAAQSLQIGIIDLYGLGSIQAADVRKTLTIKEGDSISFASAERPAFVAENEQRLTRLPGVIKASINAVCCEDGQVVVYVGLEQKGQTSVPFRDAPTGSVRLADDVLQAGREYIDASMGAVMRGDASEDDSQGHALTHDPIARAIQEKFIGFASRDLAKLRQVLRDSSDGEQRAIAAEVLGYAAVKQEVVPDLVEAMRDSNPDVRNNAMRALAVFTRKTRTGSEAAIVVPFEPFIARVNSLVWTDRNKSSLALMELSASRDPKLFEALRREALPSLIEMARWKSVGHSTPSLWILGRMGGMSDETIDLTLKVQDRDRIIASASK